MTLVDFLTKARGLIARGWTSGTWARDAEGHGLEPTHPGAIEWCALGAVVRTGHGLYPVPCTAQEVEAKAQLTGQAEYLLRQATNACAHWEVTHYNDGVIETQAEALAWFDRAIALAKDEAQGVRTVGYFFTEAPPAPAPTPEPVAIEEPELVTV